MAKFDRELVMIFVAGLNQSYGKSYGNPIFPEDEIRNEEVVEAIFTDDDGRKLAIEHTLIEPFVGERSDGFGAFDKVFGPLERDASLTVPEYHITVAVPAFAVPNGERWDAVAGVVKSWFVIERDNFPETTTRHVIPGLSFPLTLTTWKYHFPDHEGKVFIARILPPDTFQEVVKKALSKKVPKLVNAPADRRVLLLEQNVPFPGVVEVEVAIVAISHDYPDLEKIDEIWVVDTVAWKREGILFFERAFADREGNRERFKWRKGTPENGAA